MLCRQETSATARQRRGAIELVDVPSDVDSSVVSGEGEGGMRDLYLQTTVA